MCTSAHLLIFLIFFFQHYPGNINESLILFYVFKKWLFVYHNVTCNFVYNYNCLFVTCHYIFVYVCARDFGSKMESLKKNNKI